MREVQRRNRRHERNRLLSQKGRAGQRQRMKAWRCAQLCRPLGYWPTSESDKAVFVATS